MIESIMGGGGAPHRFRIYNRRVRSAETYAFAMSMKHMQSGAPSLSLLVREDPFLFTAFAQAAGGGLSKGYIDG